MAIVAKSRSRKNYGEGTPTPYWMEGRGKDAERYGFAVPATDRGGKAVHVEFDEAELRNMIEEWKRLAKGYDNAFIHSLLDAT